MVIRSHCRATSRATMSRHSISRSSREPTTIGASSKCGWQLNPILVIALMLMRRATGINVDRVAITVYIIAGIASAFRGIAGCPVRPLSAQRTGAHGAGRYAHRPV